MIAQGITRIEKEKLGNILRKFDYGNKPRRISAPKLVQTSSGWYRRRRGRRDSNAPGTIDAGVGNADRGNAIGVLIRKTAPPKDTDVLKTFVNVAQVHGTINATRFPPAGGGYGTAKTTTVHLDSAQNRRREPALESSFLDRELHVQDVDVRTGPKVVAKVVVAPERMLNKAPSILSERQILKFCGMNLSENHDGEKDTHVGERLKHDKRKG
ncbi:hypothetical protein C8R43DRAFT_965900 [Mycena crocata]|nr:hypothetical protein C8R43DRAFT_965900 [Mycena crocata]